MWWGAWLHGIMAGNALVQRQSQTMALAPQLQEGLKMLAMSLPELRAKLMDEMARNPVIDDVEATLEKTTLSDKEAEGDAEPMSDYPDDDYEPLDTARPDAEAVERRQRFFEDQVCEETLEQHLLAQLASSDIDERDYPLAEMLIGELNGDGWFVGSIPDIMMVTGESEAKVRSVLAKLREFDPPGCGATTLGECLEAQLDQIKDPLRRLAVAKLLGRLDEVAAGKAGDSESLKDLRSLEPRPGRAYRKDSRSVEYVNPEVHVVRCRDGWSAQVDARSLPEIRISRKYLAMLEDPQTSKETKAYIRERIAAARMIVEAIEKRRDTIEAIAQEIVDRQPGFFEHGLKGLTPMTMQEIADKLGIHHATVSRTVNGKYASTPKGTVELRRFFVQGVKSDSGEEVARDAVLDMLRNLVDGEDKSHPLSDERLSALLKERGFTVARRTVAKYRALAGIPGTSARGGASGGR